jgi:hypothetical protein
MQQRKNQHATLGFGVTLTALTQKFYLEQATYGYEVGLVIFFLGEAIIEARFPG